MKRTLCLLTLAAMLTGTAFATDTQHCYNTHLGLTTVCEFSPSGRVNVTSAYDDGAYYSNWYTRAEWLRYKSNPKNIDVYQKPTDVKSQSQASSWHSQNGCEGDGFAWVEGACHARGK
jgi:hypothetical protein